MGSPIIPSDICSSVPSPSALLCDKIKALFSLASKLCTFWTWAFDSSGNVTDAFATLFVRIGTPTGALLAWPVGTSTPAGYLIANSQAVNRTVYANLFSVIGTTYGAGDGTTTFNLPNLVDKFLVGASASVAVGSQGGAASVSLTAANNGAHTHRGVVTAQGANAYNIIWGSDPSGSSGTGSVYSNNHGLAQIGTAEIPISTALETSGDGAAFSVLPPFVAVIWLIKY